MLPHRNIPRLRAEIPIWLDQWVFTRFVTLAFNDASAGDASLPGSSLKNGFLLERLRQWDAQMNHRLLGKHWAERHADRMFSFFVIEKADANPHWHGLVRFFANDPVEIRRQEEVFDVNAERIWLKLVRSGTVDVQVVVDQRGASKYLAKALAHNVNYENFVVPDHFRGA